MNWYELIGYAASALVAVSLMMTSILRLRVINLLGAVLFAVYGVLIGAIPVAVVNLFIVGINIFQLGRIARIKEYFHLLEVKHDSEYLQYFLNINRADIERYQPGASTAVSAQHVIVFVLRDVVPAGVLIGERCEDGSLLIQVDYVLPGYRDFKVGEFLFQQRAAFFRERGVHRIVAHARTGKHANYLQRVGFTHAGADTYTHTVAPRI